MAAAGNNDNAGFEADMRRQWEAWAQALQAGGVAGSEFPWREGIEQWTRLVSIDTPPEIQALGARFQHQAGDWLGTMQQVAARFAGRDTTAAEVAGAWRDAVAGQGDELLRWMLGAARGGNALNDQPWMREFARAAQAGFASEDWLNAPAFGPAREHQARWQTLLKMQQEYQTRADAYVDTIRAVLDDAFKRFESKLAAHEAPGSQLTSARAMFDLWIDAAEEAYASMALSEEFQRIYGELANAQMRLRAASQRELERACDAMGVPTRTEMDAAHRRIAELERQVRRLLAATTQAAAGVADPFASQDAGRKAGSKLATKRPAKKAVNRKTVASKEVTAKTPARKAAPVKTVGGKTAARKAATGKPGAAKAKPVRKGGRA